MASGVTHPSTTAVLPVKRIGSAKQRLSSVLSEQARAELAEAMFLDVLTKTRRSRDINQIIVVTADPAIARTTRWMGLDVIEQDEDDGHSRAAIAGVDAALAGGVERVAILPADCPLLDPRELDAHLGSAPRAALIVPDRHGTGTNALILSPPDAFAPAFGPDSCARHVSRARASGVAFALERIESLALDLDTPEDLVLLRDALVLDPQRAIRTSQVVWELGEVTSRIEQAVA
jgi:2-phospho-L-lactate guanylyltransferase